MPQDAMSAALLGAVEAALSALTPEEERALRVRFGLGVVADADGRMAAAVTRSLEVQALKKLRSDSIEGSGCGAGGRRVRGYRPSLNRAGMASRPHRAPVDGDADVPPPHPGPAPEPPPYDVTGWDEA